MKKRGIQHGRGPYRALRQRLLAFSPGAWLEEGRHSFWVCQACHMPKV